MTGGEAPLFDIDTNAPVGIGKDGVLKTVATGRRGDDGRRSS